MGLERRWLQAVTTAVAICLLSEYAHANMDPLHLLTMRLHSSSVFNPLQGFSQYHVTQVSVIMFDSVDKRGFTVRNHIIKILITTDKSF